MFTERPAVAGVLAIPRWVLVPTIAILAVVGVYSLLSDRFAIYLILIISVLGYLLRKHGFSLTKAKSRLHDKQYNRPGR